MKSSTKLATVTAVVGVLLLGLTAGAGTPSTPEEGATTPNSTWGLLQADGSVVPLIENPDLPEPPAAEGEVTPMLIGPVEYYNCWTLGWEGLNFGNHYYWWDGEQVIISLLCGTSGYGYRHIAIDHQADWENVIAAANDTSGTSWDDLMSFAIDASMLNADWPGIVGPGAANKMCSTARLAWYPNGIDQPPTYTHRTITIWSYNNKTVINAYPIRESHNGCDINNL